MELRYIADQADDLTQGLVTDAARQAEANAYSAEVELSRRQKAVAAIPEKRRDTQARFPLGIDRATGEPTFRILTPNQFVEEQAKVADRLRAKADRKLARAADLAGADPDLLVVEARRSLLNNIVPGWEQDYLNHKTRLAEREAVLATDVLDDDERVEMVANAAENREAIKLYEEMLPEAYAELDRLEVTASAVEEAVPTAEELATADEVAVTE